VVYKLATNKNELACEITAQPSHEATPGECLSVGAGMLEGAVFSVNGQEVRLILVNCPGLCTDGLQGLQPHTWTSVFS